MSKKYFSAFCFIFLLNCLKAQSDKETNNNTNILTDTIVPIVKIDTIVSHGKKFCVDEEKGFLGGWFDVYSLKFYLNLDNQAMSYEGVEFRYKLSNDTEWSDWHSSKANSKEYYFIEKEDKGSYILYAQARKNGIYSNIDTFKFRVITKWERFWHFKLFIILMIIYLIYPLPKDDFLFKIEYNKVQRRLRNLGKVWFFLLIHEILSNYFNCYEIPYFFPLIMYIGFYLLIIWVKYGSRVHTIELYKERIDEDERKLIEEEEKLQEEREKNQLRVYTILNQLNPHFIGNSLSWLRVRMGQDEEAVSVIVKLASNIKTVFKNSRSKKIAHELSEEFILAENYLFIQEKRFGKDITYEFPNKEIIAKFADLNIPMMILQLHCENAIEHGLRNIAQDDVIGFVKISIEEEDNYVNLIVEDNGVGLIKAKEIGSTGTQESTKMMAELEDILNKYNPENLPLRTKIYENDIFYSSERGSHGTRVIMKIPKIFNYDI